MCKLYSAVLNGGYCVEPKLVLGEIMNSDMKSITSTQPKKVFSKKYCEALYRMLCFVVTDGTGKTAMSEKCVVAGKTATAQTGLYLNNKEKLISYFIGLFSIKGENYTVLVMRENGISGANDCAPVFKEICEGIVELKKFG